MRKAITFAMWLAVMGAPGNLYGRMQRPYESAMVGQPAGRPYERAVGAEMQSANEPRATQPIVVDRIVARIEDDILTLSEMRELGRFQQLANGPGSARNAASDDELLRQLIDQWIVNTEAGVAQFPGPTKEEVQAEVSRLAAQFGSEAAYRARLKELELTPESVARQVERQIYLARFLDYKLRPTAQVGSAEVEKYYNEELVPELKKRGQRVPPLDEVDEQIRELLTQKEISTRVTKWLDDTRSRLKIDIVEPKKR